MEKKLDQVKGEQECGIQFKWSVSGKSHRKVTIGQRHEGVQGEDCSAI